MFKTIVVGVDGRDGGRDALSLAGRLALLAGGELVAVRVLPFDYYASRAGAPPYTSLAEHDARSEVAAELERAGLEARIAIAGDSSPARALHRVAEREDADVIVVGSTHHGRAGRVFAGDDAVATLHGSPCAVAVAPRGLGAREWKVVAKVGVGFDGSPEAGQAFALAVKLARDCGASLVVRSVVATPIPYADFTAYDDDWTERAIAAAKADLAEVLADVDVEAVSDVRSGMPVDELAELSEHVDLLVLGSRAWGPVRRVVMGSTAASLSRESRAPLLVLPRGAATGQPGEEEVRQSHMTVA
jgi:nucleotide-binding universal stress UspA family protein